MILPRRQFLTGLGLLLAAPAIVHASNLMPVRSLPPELLAPAPPMIPVVAGSVISRDNESVYYAVMLTGMLNPFSDFDKNPMVQRLGPLVGIPE